ncbi:MAG: hypothetical protein ACXWE7_14035 [Nitrososphaeraceae archaeon]
MNLGKFSTNLFNHVLEIWINPEIEKREIESRIPKNFQISKIQILIKPGEKPLVRFNDEVLAEIIAHLTPGVRKSVLGEPVYNNEIQKICKIQLTDKDDPDSGHLTMILLKNKWYIYFDFRMNKKKANARLEVGKEFLNVAEICLNKKYFRAFIDNLFSAVELFVISHLFIISEQEYTLNTTHRNTSHKYNNYIKIGNYKNAFKDLFNKLNGERNNARYLKDSCKLNTEKAQSMFKIAKELSEFTERCII